MTPEPVLPTQFLAFFGMISLAAGMFGAADTSRTAQPAAVFTAAQAAQGQTVYQTHCASCHAADLGGRTEAPALTGPDFLKTWGAQTTAQLLEFVQATMPPDGGEISPDDYLAVVALVLQRNGATAGDQALTAATAVEIASITRRP